MKKVLIDTNFILSCMRKKIDFFQALRFMGFKIIIPIQVINELKTLKHRGKINLENQAHLALKLLRKKRFERIDLQDDKVDRAITRFAKNNKDVAIATLDKELKARFSNKKVVIRGQKMLEVF